MTNAKRLLLVEDDRYIGLALKIRLCAAGYDVVIATGVKNALVAIAGMLPAIAVIDINLPDGNGIDLMSTISKEAGDASIVVVVMTASRTPGLREQAIENGAVAFLEKPFPSADLLEVISSLDYS